MVDEIGIWYVVPWVGCNFHCPYCVTEFPRKFNKGADWEGTPKHESHKKIIEWIRQLPFRVRLRMQTVGEPFMSQDILNTAASLSKLDKFKFVEMLTNASLLKKRFKRLADQADVDKISLWATFHTQGEITLQEFIENVLHARGFGASVFVNVLAFPDNLHKIEQLAAACDEHQLRMSIDIGHNFQNVCNKGSFLPVLDQDHEQFAGLLHRLSSWGNLDLASQILAHSSPAGLPCAAGHDYFCVNNDGNVKLCSWQAKPIGNVLEDPGFVLPIREEPYAPCVVTTGCLDMEEGYHLKMVHELTVLDGSMKYRVLKPGVSDKQVRRNEATAMAALGRRMALGGLYPDHVERLPNFAGLVQIGIEKNLTNEQIAEFLVSGPMAHMVSDKARDSVQAAMKELVDFIVSNPEATEREVKVATYEALGKL